MLEKLCNLASDDLLNVVCRSCLSLISLRAVVEGDQHLVSTSPPPPPPPYISHFLGENYRKKRRRLPLFRQKYRVDTEVGSRPTAVEYAASTANFRALAISNSFIRACLWLSQCIDNILV